LHAGREQYRWSFRCRQSGTNKRWQCKHFGGALESIAPQLHPSIPQSSNPAKNRVSGGSKSYAEVDQLFGTAEENRPEVKPRISNRHPVQGFTSPPA
jgi:hypothetical protein